MALCARSFGRLCETTHRGLLRPHVSAALTSLFHGGGCWETRGRPEIFPDAGLASPQLQATRGVARVRINRLTGVRSIKKAAPKTEWQIAAEREFLASRAQVPKEGYLWGMTADDVRHLSPAMQRCLSIRCGTNADISRFRKAEWIRKFQRRPFDFSSPAVVIAMLTEKILRLRAHLLRYHKHHVVKRSMSIFLARRQRVMRSLYRSDFVLYQHVCKELGIRCVRFAIPPPKDPQLSINPQAVDGDRMKFLIRQRLYRKGNRPRELREPETGKKIRYTRHPLEPVPISHGRPKPTPQQVSRAWPYGVREDRVAGKQVMYNPSAAGKGFWPVKLGGHGGRTPFN